MASSLETQRRRGRLIVAPFCAVPMNSGLSGGRSAAVSEGPFTDDPDSSGSSAADRLPGATHGAMLMTVYSTGMRRAEKRQLKVEDIDSNRMLIHTRQGKGRRDLDVPSSPKLLETLHEDWRWMKPRTCLFPGTR